MKNFHHVFILHPKPTREKNTQRAAGAKLRHFCGRKVRQYPKVIPAPQNGTYGQGGNLPHLRTCAPLPDLHAARRYPLTDMRHG